MWSHLHWYSRLFGTQKKLEQQLGPFLWLFSSPVRVNCEKAIAGQKQRLSEVEEREEQLEKRCAWRQEASMELPSQGVGRLQE